MSAGEPVKTPRHVAIIMDGNGRWARERGLPRIKGHEAGAESVNAALRACRDLGIPYLTLYAFSVENWIRPPDEVMGLMGLLRLYLRRRARELHENQVRLHAIGRLGDLPSEVREELERTIAETAKYTERHLILALSYGGRAEIVDAARALARRVRAGELDPEAIDERELARHLYAPDIPDPDLMIRTSGEIRLSNFLLWELSYAEFYFTDVLWPDFREPHLRAAVDEFARRHRRFGDVR